MRRSCLAVPASSERFIEKARGLPAGQTGIEAQIEDAGGLAAVNAIAAASPRLEASRKLAEVVVARGNAAGFGKTGEAP